MKSWAVYLAGASLGAVCARFYEMGEWRLLMAGIAVGTIWLFGRRPS